METAKLFNNGGSQAVRLPKGCRFEGSSEVYAKKYGDVVYLFPQEKAWEIFVNSLDMFSDDYMADRREQPPLQARTTQ